MTQFGVMPRSSNFFRDPGRKNAPPPPRIVRLYESTPEAAVRIKDAYRRGHEDGFDKGFKAGMRVLNIENALRDDSVEVMTGICREECRKHSVSMHEMFGRRKNKNIVRARHDAMARCYLETKCTTSCVAAFFGGYDHSTIVYVVRKYRSSRIDKGVPR